MRNRWQGLIAQRVALAVAGVALGVVAAAAQMTPAPANNPEAARGYLPKAALPDSVALLPPPPAAGSAALALDEEISRADLALQGGPRWKLAALDADLSFPSAAGDFACALGAPVTEEDTPRLYRLLLRARADAGGSTGAAKERYQRARPFMENKQPTCSPDAEANAQASCAVAIASSYRPASA